MTATMNCPDVPSVSLRGGADIPQLGFGTFQIPPEQTTAAVTQALQLGYRHIDTAAGYDNESQVGLALKTSGLDRADIFVTTKLRNGDQGYDRTLAAFEDSRRKLQVDAVDLYLIHWPVPVWGKYVETWRALTKLLNDGMVRAIGVSNFLPPHLRRIVDETGVVPAVNQIEVHPGFSQPNTLQTCAAQDITVEAYSPLGQGADLDNPVVTQIASDHAVTPAQAILRWHLQRGRVVIPKSTHVDRMRENLHVFDFILDDQQLQAIDTLHAARNRIGNDPATAQFTQIH
jgi:2,5-diketo-D-gluconate reductase A